MSSYTRADMSGESSVKHKGGIKNNYREETGGSNVDSFHYLDDASLPILSLNANVCLWGPRSRCRCVRLNRGPVKLGCGGRWTHRKSVHIFIMWIYSLARSWFLNCCQAEVSSGTWPSSELHSAVFSSTTEQVSHLTCKVTICYASERHQAVVLRLEIWDLS